MILVTGGTGLLGGHLLHQLVVDNEEIVALYRSKKSIEITRDIFNSYGHGELVDRINWVQGDILDTALLEDLMTGVKFVYHAAAMVSFDPSIRDELMEINITGTANIVNVCLEKKIKKLCYVSSVGAFGKAKRNEPVNESTHWENDLDPSGYSVSKFHAEMEVWRGIEEGLNAVIVNPTTILGEGNWERGSSKIFQTVHNGLRFYTNGNNGYVDVRDVVSIMLELTRGPHTKERFLLVSENLGYKEFLTMVAKTIGKDPPSIKVGPKLAKIVVWWGKFLKILTGRSPIITSETAKVAMSTQLYSNQKIRERIGYDFIPVAVSIERVGKYYLTSEESES